LLKDACIYCDLIIGETRERGLPCLAGNDINLFNYRSPLSRQDDGFCATISRLFPAFEKPRSL
jgi:hypothetical protein